MDPSEMDSLVRRLVQNPHDQEAITRAHHAGQSDPRAYATVLEKVGTSTTDPALSSHWLTEAANVWITTLNDHHRAAKALLLAVDRDPAQSAAVDRLTELYNSTQDSNAIAEMLERRAKALEALGRRDAAYLPMAAAVYEEAGRQWSESPLSNSQRSIASFRKALEHDATSQYAIYALRELYKATGQFVAAVPYFAMEQALVADSERKLALFTDEAAVRKSAGDVDGAFAAMANALQIVPDPTTKQQAATQVLEATREGRPATTNTLEGAADLFVQLAEEYPGEHGLAYSECALELAPGNDRAVQLAIYYAEQLGRTAEVAALAAGYLQANPMGPLADQARAVAGNAEPPPPPAATASRGVQSGSGAYAGAAFRAPAPARGPVSEQDVDDLLERAEELSTKNRRNEAAKTYQQILELDPAQADAIAYLQSHFRKTRKFRDLKTVLVGAASSAELPVEERRAFLEEAATLCEKELRDMPGAIEVWQQIVDIAADEDAREQLKRLLTRASRWDDMAVLLLREAEDAQDVEVRINTEKSLAQLHEKKRKDLVAAGEAWARIAALAPGDEATIEEAVMLFEKAKRPDLAATVIADSVVAVEDEAAKANLYTKLGNLRQASEDFVGAGEAFAEGAGVSGDAALWEAAENCFAHVGQWDAAANAADSRTQLIEGGAERAAVFARIAGYLGKTGDEEGAVLRLEQATELAPSDDRYASDLEEKLTGLGRHADLAAFFLARAEKLTDAPTRVTLRKRAAAIHREALNDSDAAREALELVLLDGDDHETLSLLATDAENRGEIAEAVSHLSRLAELQGGQEKVGTLLREGKLLAEAVDDADGAIARYETILRDLDPSNETAFEQIARLQEERGDIAGCAKVIERHLTVAGADAKVPLALRLAAFYEGPLDQPKDAMRVLGIVHEADPDDFEAIQRLCNLAEQVQAWEPFVKHLQSLVAVEGDEAEASTMTLRIAEVQANELGKNDDALATLATLADTGDDACRGQLVELGDKLDKGEHVADKLVQWHADAPSSEPRKEALHGAFERYVKAGAAVKAAAVAKTLARSRAAQAGIAETLERIAVELKDLDALSVAHELIAGELSGAERAIELVRQARVLLDSGVDAAAAVQHGEQGLASVDPPDVEDLLQRLSELCPTDDAKIDLYERQVGRCKSSEDRLNALARAAQVAAERSNLPRAKQFFDIALSGTLQADTIERLVDIATESDRERGDKVLRRTIAECFANGGRSARDGGRTRAGLLRRAAQLVHADLGDVEQAFVWLGEALVVHVSDEGLADLDELATEVADHRRMERILDGALTEVFDGPLVRKLLKTRAMLREQRLNNKPGAAEDLRRLYDLSPGDLEVGEQLAVLYTELEDYAGIVRLYEDQILRGRDPEARAVLARKVAILWRDQLKDPRETADAWRRVLRFRRNDEEAKQGLADAKTAMLNTRHEATPEAEAPPPVALSTPRESSPEPALQASAPELQVSAPAPEPQASSTATPDPVATPDARRKKKKRRSKRPAPSAEVTSGVSSSESEAEAQAESAAPASVDVAESDGTLGVEVEEADDSQAMSFEPPPPAPAPPALAVPPPASAPRGPAPLVAAPPRGPAPLVSPPSASASGVMPALGAPPVPPARPSTLPSARDVEPATAPVPPPKGLGNFDEVKSSAPARSLPPPPPSSRPSAPPPPPANGQLGGPPPPPPKPGTRPSLPPPAVADVGRRPPPPPPGVRAGGPPPPPPSRSKR